MDRITYLPRIVTSLWLVHNSYKLCYIMNLRLMLRSMSTESRQSQVGVGVGGGPNYYRLHVY